MDTEKSIIANELVGALDERNIEIQTVTERYMTLPPDDRILTARDVFLGFDKSSQRGGEITTYVRIEDRPDVIMEGKIEFPTTLNTDLEDRKYPYKWTNKLAIRARVINTPSIHNELDFTPLGVIRFHESDPALLYTDEETVLLGNEKADNVMEIIDSAVIDIAEKKEDIRKTMGRRTLAAAWEVVWKDEEAKSKSKPKKIDFLRHLMGRSKK